MINLLSNIRKTTALTAMAAAASLAVWSCGGGGGGSYSSGSTTSPSGSTSGSSAPGTITIVGSAGPTAFSPNPIQGVAAGNTITFTNRDSTMHHITMDDGSGDVGDINPGASKVVVLKTSGGNYHCTIHPSMVGSVNGATAPTPPPDSGGGY